jgi:DNA-binding NarL/FixJ family response regulator
MSGFLSGQRVIPKESRYSLVNNWNTQVMVSIGILEDDSLLRSVLAEALSGRGIRVAISSGTVEGFLTSSSRNHIDCAVLDLHLGAGATGIDVANELVRIYPAIGIVFLTSFEDPRLVGSNRSDMPEGSVYLQKHAVKDTEVLVDAISAAISKAPTKRAIGKTLIGLLNDNQVEILALVAAGMSNSEIAKVKSISEKSVEAAITRISKALDLRSTPSQNQRVHMARVFFRARGNEIADR